MTIATLRSFKFVENIEKTFPLYYMHSDAYKKFKTSITLYCVTRLEVIKCLWERIVADIILFVWLKRVTSHILFSRNDDVGCQYMYHEIQKANDKDNCNIKLCFNSHR